MNIYEKLDHMIEFFEERIKESEDEEASLAEWSHECIGFERGFRFGLEEAIKYVKRML